MVRREGWDDGPQTTEGVGHGGSERVGCVPDQDHLLLELPTGVKLGADLVVEVEKLFQRLGLGGHDEADDVHQQCRHGVAVEHDGEDGLHSLNLGLVGTLLELGTQLVGGRDVGSIVLVDQAVGVVEEGRHDCGGVVSSSKSSSRHAECVVPVPPRQFVARGVVYRAARIR